MVKARLIRLVSLLALPALLGAVSWLSRGTPIDPDPEESADRVEWRRFNERCASDSLKTLAPVESEPEPDAPATDPEPPQEEPAKDFRG